MQVRSTSESQMQIDFFSWVRRQEDKRYSLIRGDPAGVNTGGYQGLVRKNMGQLKGWPDITVPLPSIHGGHFFCHLYIELKKPGGTVSSEQKSVIEHLNAEGSFAVVSYCIEECKRLVVDWMRGNEQYKETAGFGRGAS